MMSTIPVPHPLLRLGYIFWAIGPNTLLPQDNTMNRRKNNDSRNRIYDCSLDSFVDRSVTNERRNRIYPK
jgi:hypothetical protein